MIASFSGEEISIMKIQEIKEKIHTLKKVYGKIETNIYPGILCDEQEADLIENEKALVFVIQEPNRKRAFFASADEKSLSSLLTKLPSGAVTEYVFRKKINPLKDIFENGNMEKYTSYIRETVCYSESPFSVRETGRRKLLEQMYDPTCGEYAKKEDAVELYELTKDTFDVLCDDIFTLEQWEKIISVKNCVLYRENGKIIAFYVFRLEGKKLYSNISVNKGAANHLYNLERRVFDEMWNKGIRVFYAWINNKNTKALKRNIVDKSIKSKHVIYNSVYIKK